MAFKVFHSATFDKELEKYPKEFKEWIDRIEDQLVINPFVGDPIKVSWLREKKRDKFRIYYLIYDELKSVYMVGISDKKDQQKIINTIWLLLDNFRDEIKEMAKKI